MIFPELFGGVFAGDALKDLGAAWVLINEIGNVVDRVIDDDVHALVGGVVRRDFGWRDCLGHLELLRDSVWSRFEVLRFSVRRRKLSWALSRTGYDEVCRGSVERIGIVAVVDARWKSEQSVK